MPIRYAGPPASQSTHMRGNVQRTASRNPAGASSYLPANVRANPSKYSVTYFRSGRGEDSNFVYATYKMPDPKPASTPRPAPRGGHSPAPRPATPRPPSQGPITQAEINQITKPATGLEGTKVSPQGSKLPANYVPGTASYSPYAPTSGTQVGFVGTRDPKKKKGNVATV